MYLAAQGLLSYLGRPEYGTNYVNMASLSSNNGNNKASFFDKVNATKV